MRFVLFLGILFLAVTSYAQPCDGCPPGGGEPVPISGIEILLVGGVALGLKKLNDFKKNWQSGDKA